MPSERICIVLLTGLGDVVHGLPIANALKDADPEREITWVAEPMPATILERHPSVDRIVRYERRRGWRGVTHLQEAMRAVRRTPGAPPGGDGDGFDLTLNFNVYLKSVWPVLFSRGRRRVGFGADRARDGVWLAATERLPRRPRRHTQEMFLEFLEHLRVPHHPPSVPADWRLTFGDDERRAQDAFFAERSGRPLAAIVPASGNRKKDWPAERWAAVADALVGDFGFEVALVGGPGAREVVAAREVAERARHPLVWAMGDGVRRVAWTLERCALVLAPDTGPLHLARAMGVPVIGLFGHTNPWRVGPYRAYEDLWVDKYTDGAPDPSAFDPPRQNRMLWITPGEVVERVRRAVERYAAPR